MLRNHATIVMAMMLLAVAVASAQFEVMPNRTGNVQYYVSNYGLFGHNSASVSAGFMYPRGSNNRYIFGSGIWFGAQKSVNDTMRRLTFIAYNPNSGASWSKPGEADASLTDDDLYYSGDHDRQTGAYIGAGIGSTWPLWMRVGDEVTPRDPGTYVADVDSRNSAGGFVGPAFMPNVDEQFVARFHDGDLRRYEVDAAEFGFPIGLQIQQNIYSFAPVSRYASAVVIQYQVINISDDTLRDCVVGQASDPDLGNAANDRVAIYRGRDGKARAGVTTTEAEQGPTTYESLAQILLESPAIDANGFVDNSLRYGQINQHEIHTWRNWTLAMDPKTAPERYEFMLGPSQDGDNGAGDKRTMLATRPFNMAPGDTAHFSMAYAVLPSPFGMAHGDDKSSALLSAGPNDVPSLDELIESLVDDYRVGMFRPNVSPSGVDDEAAMVTALSIAPNPAQGAASVAFATGSAGDVDLNVLNAMGERVAAKSLGYLSAGSHRTTIDLGDFASGTYLVVIDAAGARRTTLMTVAR